MAKYSFDEYRQALEAGAYTPEAQAELLNKYPYLKYDKPTISTALNEGAYDDQARKTLFNEFPEFQPAGITDALKAAPELAYQGAKEGILGAVQGIGENAYKMDNFLPPLPPEAQADLTARQVQTPMTPENIAAVKIPETQKRIQDIYAERNIQPGTVGGVAADVFTSIGQMAPVVGLSMIAPEAAPAGLAFLSTISGGQKYAEARRNGYDEKQAALQGIGYGAAEAIGEKIGLDALMDGFKNVAKRPALINIVREVLKNAGVEAGEEGATQILQNAIDIAGKKYNPQTTGAAPGLFENVPYAAMTGGITGGLMGGASSAIGSVAKRVKPAEKEMKVTPEIEKNNEVWTEIGQLNADEINNIVEQADAENVVPEEVKPEIQNNAPEAQQPVEVVPEGTNTIPVEQNAPIEQKTAVTPNSDITPQPVRVEAPRVTRPAPITIIPRSTPFKEGIEVTSRQTPEDLLTRPKPVSQIVAEKKAEGLTGKSLAEAVREEVAAQTISARPITEVGLKENAELPPNVWLHGSKYEPGTIKNFTVATDSGTLYLTRDWDTARNYAGQKPEHIKVVELNSKAKIFDLNDDVQAEKLAKIIREANEDYSEMTGSELQKMNFREAGLSDNREIGNILYDANVDAVLDTNGHADIINDNALKTYRPESVGSNNIPVQEKSTETQKQTSVKPPIEVLAEYPELNPTIEESSAVETAPITDRARIQEIKNSIAEGELILRTGKIHGRKLSPDELGAVRRSVENAKRKIGGNNIPSGAAFAAPIEKRRPEPTPYEHKIAGLLNSLNRVELVQLAEELLNAVPEVRKKLSHFAQGRFSHVDDPKGIGIGRGSIKLNAAALKEADFQYISDVLAHEIGHAVDWKEGKLINQTLSRGNALGHIAALARFLKTTLNLEPDGKPEYLTTKERAKIRRQAKKEITKMGIIYSDDPEFYKAELKEIYRGLIEEYLEENNLITREMAKMEMLDLTQKWWNIPDELMNDEEYLAYLSKPSELYANTFGAFLTNPGFLFEEAPTVANMLYDYMRNRPATLKLYQYFQQKINSGGRFKDNLNYIKAKMMQADARQAAHMAKQNERQGIVDDMTTNLIDRLTPLLKYATVANRDESSFKMLSTAQRLRSINDIVESYLKGFLPEISKIIEDNHLDITDIGLKAYFTRVIEERSKRGIIDLTDEKLANKLNDELDKNYTGEQIKAMETIFDKLHQARRPMIQSLIDKGLFTKDLAVSMLDNKNYFTFDITEHLEKTLGPGNSVSQRIHKQIGTLKVTANPFVSTILKDIALMRLDTEMDFMKQTVSFLRDKGVTITKARKDMHGRLMQPPLKSGMGLIEMLNNGKAEGFYIPADIAKAVNDNTFDIGAGMQTLAAINNISRGTFTAANPAFIFSNLFRDVTGTFIKVPHILMNFGAWSKKMANALKNAALDSTEDKKVINEMLGRGLLYGERSMNYQPDTDLSTWDNILRKYKIANYEDFDAKNAPWYLKAVNMLTAAGELLTSPVINLSNRIERATKIGTFEFLKEIKNKYNLSDAEINWIVSDLAGTPNGKRKGRWTPYTNNIFLFSNIWAQSYKSHLDAYKYGGTEYLAKLGILSVVPTLLTFILSRTDDDDGWWSKISEYYKSGYNIVPVWWFGGPRFDENGNPVFLTFPKEETQRAIGATLWKALNSFKDGEIREGLTQIFDTWSGDVPKFAPALTALWSISQYSSGQNPYDYFRGGNVIDPRTFAAKDFDTDKAFLTHLANLFGLNVFYKMDPSYKAKVAEKPSTLETISKTPLYGANVVGRFFKVDDRGEQQQIRELMDDRQTTSAREKKVANGYIEKMMGGRQDDITPDEYAAAKKQEGYVRNEIRRLRSGSDAYKIRSAPRDLRRQVRDILK